MASNYKKIAEENQVRYGSDPEYRRFFYEQLYKEKTHFVYEFIQNAVDSKSSQLELRLGENELFVWNDGDQFNEKDVRSICSLGSSSKDLTQIGTFGIGFKSVYNYTDYPEIYSDDEHFRIRDLTQPEGIDKMTPQIVEQVSQGRTVFRLPFKDDLSQKDIVLLKDQFCKLGERYILLFLRDLQRDFKKDFKTIRWFDERDGQTGICSCIHHRHSKIQDASEVELTMSLNGENQLSEMFLVFHKVVQPPENVIDALLKQTKHGEKREKIQQSAKKQQPIEVAFKLHDGSITAIDDNSVLFAYLPTQKETHLRFLIQARYQTTSGRADIQDPSENPWNRWLVEETAKFLPEILEQLKAAELLEPAFFNVLPLERNVKNEFKPIGEALQKAMKERAFVPTQSGGYAKAENVFYPHRESLQELVESSWLYPNSSWLHTDIGQSGRAFEVMKKAGVKEINVSHVLDWLKKQDNNWFESRCKEWLRSLYIYLNSQGSELGRIKRLPLVRLENGRHVSMNYELVFFPPDTDEEREDLRPFLTDLPILQSVLLDGEEGNDIKAFLGKLGVRVLNSEEMISKWIIPQYRWSDRPSKEQNRLHVRYIFKVWNKLSDKLGYEHRQLKEELGKVPILLVYNSGQPETYDFVKPCNAYLPKAYTGDTHLETYFSVCNDDIWFVDEAYLEDKSDVKAWFQFLKAIGSMNTLQVDKVEVVGSYEECEERGITRQRSTREFEDGSFIDRYYSGHFNGAIEDFEFAGLLEVFNQISDHNKVNLSHSLWSLLIKAIEPLSSEKKSRWPWTSSRDAFFQCTYHRFYRGHQRAFFDATFYRQLKETAWLPDKQGNLHRPSDCFVPTDDNRKVLGDSVPYLHPDFDVSQDNEAARWLAEKLGIHLNANTDSVINYLQTLSGTETSVEKVEPLYRFLDRQDARRSEEFKQKPLIFTSNPEPYWWRSDEVFWEDESEVFKNDRGYLKSHYPATLKSFFTDLGVSPQASQRDYARRIQEIATIEQAEDKKVRERVQRLYRCLQPWHEKKWEIIYNGRCWLGKKGDEWEFFTRQELVLKDHPHIGEIFEGEVPFWTFDGDLSSLARNLKVEGCSQAEVEFHPDGDQEKDTDWSEKVRKLRPYIYAFLNSPRLCEESDIFMFSGNEQLEKEKFAKFSTNCSVWRVKELRVTYELKGISVPDPNPRQGFFDVTDQPAKLWLGLKGSEDECPELIGDALQGYFGVKELGRFVEDLLTKDMDRVLSNWKRKGLDTDLCILSQENNFIEDEEESPEPDAEGLPNETIDGNADLVADESNGEAPTDNESNNSISIADEAEKSETHPITEDDNFVADESEVETPIDSEAPEISEVGNSSTPDRYETSTGSSSDIRNISSSDIQAPTKTKSVTAQPINGGSGVKTPTINESSGIGNGDASSATTSSRTSGANRSGGHSLNTYTSRKSGMGGHGGHGGGGEGEEHENLKRNLADNPSQFGEELKLVKVEYTFGSGDRVDILLKDGSDNPVTVEVETGFSSGPGRYVGVWQAVKYQHLAAMEHSLACEQVRSILAAPEIPDDVKEKCEELGIEPFEVTQR